jgi:hypothetical protein
MFRCCIRTDDSTINDSGYTSLVMSPWFNSRKGQEVFLYSTASRPALGTTHHPIKRVLGALTPWLKRQGHEADRSPPSTAEVKNGGAIPPFPIYLNGVVLNKLSTGTNLYFTFAVMSVTGFWDVTQSLHLQGWVFSHGGRGGILPRNVGNRLTAVCPRSQSACGYDEMVWVHRRNCLQVRGVPPYLWVD